MLEQKTVKTPLKVGVVGCGYWGPKLARNFHELADSELSMVCDFRSDRLEHMHSLYPQCQVTSRYADLLEADLDAIVVATPVNRHYPWRARRWSGQACAGGRSPSPARRRRRSN